MRAAAVAAGVVGLVLSCTGSAAAASTYEMDPYRWSTCLPITVKVNLDGAKHKRKSMADVKRAAARVSDRSGLRLKWGGKTSRRTPVEGEIIVRWGTMQYRSSMAETQRFVYSNNEMSKATITVKRGQRWSYGTGRTGTGKGSLLRAMMHETAHTVGVGHTRDRRQVMYVDNIDRGTTWGSGDLKALRKAGSQSRCSPNAKRL